MNLSPHVTALYVVNWLSQIRFMLCKFSFNEFRIMALDLNEYIHTHNRVEFRLCWETLRILINFCVILFCQCNLNDYFRNRVHNVQIMCNAHVPFCILLGLNKVINHNTFTHNHATYCNTNIIHIILCALLQLFGRKNIFQEVILCSLTLIYNNKRIQLLGLILHTF